MFGEFAKAESWFRAQFGTLPKDAAARQRWGVCLLLLASSAPCGAQRGCMLPARLSVPGPAQPRAAAAFFLAHRQSDCAISVLRQAIASTPDSAPLHSLLGRTLLEGNDLASARTELEKAVSIDPKLVDAQLALGVAEHDAGDRAGALEHWATAAQLDPGSTVALDWIAKARIEREEYTEAIDLLRTAPHDENLAVDLLVAQSRSYFGQEAMETATEALKAHPDWRQLRIALGTVLLQNNRLEESLELLRAAMAAEPASEEVQSLYLRALVLNGNYSDAQSAAAKLLAAEPHAFWPLYVNAVLEEQAGKLDVALAHLEEAKIARPKDPDVLLQLGVVLNKLHRWSAAEEELIVAAELPDAPADVHFQLASAWRGEGKTEQAATEMKLYQAKLAERSRRDQLISLSARASQQLHDGAFAQAEATEQQVLEQFPDQAVHWYDLALALDGQGKSQEAAAALSHAVTIRPDFAVAWNQLGYEKARSGQTGEAEIDFRKAVALAPQYAEAENNLGSLLSSEGRDAEAEPLFRSALDANPRLTEAWVNLAASEGVQGKRTEAQEAVRQALRVDPGNKDAGELARMLEGAPASPR